MRRKSPSLLKHNPRQSSSLIRNALEPARAEESVEAIVKKSAEAFATAYNAADAKAIAAGFTPDGEFIDEDGQVIKGRRHRETFRDGFRGTAQGPHQDCR